ncbi:hypothetical protein [Kocuria sp.]|uniref:hypothetical protein n=1 Tax=Kocuria sp. TaxID=1871328 RepID=UPI0026DFE5BB|nr:hypothetical protein [Kocuria sp.]MDO5619745.1 hypothetical protein [Kocuria sp.]
MTTLVMPRLTGSRLSARDLVDQISSQPLCGETIVLDALPMHAASQSYADELVLQILDRGEAARFEVHGATERFARHLEVSAQVRGVSDRISVTARPGT